MSYISSKNGTLGLVIDATIVTYVAYDKLSILQQVKDVFNASMSNIEKYAPLHYSTSLDLNAISININSDNTTSNKNIIFYRNKVSNFRLRKEVSKLFLFVFLFQFYVFVCCRSYTSTK